MSSLNKAILIGHLGKNAEVTSTPIGKRKLFFTMATNANFRDKDGNWQTETDWHNVISWSEFAIAKQDMLTKGKQVYVEGRIKNRKYEKDGEKRSITEVSASRILLLGRSENGGHHAEAVTGADEELESPF